MPAPALGPKQEGELRLPLKRVAPGPGAEAFLKVRYALAKDEVWAKAGHVVAWEQLPLPAGEAAPAVALAAMPPVELDESGPALTVKGQGFSVAVGRASGALESFRHEGRELVASPLVPNFWRVPLDNDIGFLLLNDMPRRLAAWKTAGPQRRVASVKAERLSPQAVRITAEATLPAASSSYVTTWTVYGSGDVVVEARFTPGGELPELPRFGMQMAVPGALGTMTWLGRGPHENYWDRHTGAAVGRYSGRVEDLVHDYVRPQENANRTDVRWVALTGAGRRAVSSPPASRSSASARGPTRWRTSRRRRTSTSCPGGTRSPSTSTSGRWASGGDDGWGARPHAEYTLDAKPYAYRFRLRPYAPSMGSLDEVARRGPPRP